MGVKAKQSTLSVLIFIFKAQEATQTTMNQRVYALTSFYGQCENARRGEPTRTLGGFTAYCFCCNYNGKKDVSAHRGSYCGEGWGGRCCKDLEPRGVGSFDAAAPWLEVGVGGVWVGDPPTLPCSDSFAASGRQSSHPGLATQQAGSKSFTPPWLVWESGKHHGD